MAYAFYNDPGHAWMAVKRAELERLGILDKISSYSYQRGKTVYLEEDCDYSIFKHAKMAKGEDFVAIEKYTDNRSPIRSYEHFRP